MIKSVVERNNGMKQTIPDSELFLQSFKILKVFSKKGQSRFLSLAEIKSSLKKLEEPLEYIKESIDLLFRKKLLNKKGNKYHLDRKLPIQAEGVLSAHFRGFGFVAFQGGLWGEVFIPKQKMRGAVDGDHVQVKIDYSKMDKKGPDGSILAIIKRNRKSIVGVVKHPLANGDMVAYSALLNDTIVIRKSSNKKTSEVGDRVIIKVINWGDEGADLEGELEECLGSIYDPSIDVDVALEEYHLSETFPKDVEKELSLIPKRVSPKDYKGRKDFRDELTVTIDPKTAKDFDDAITFKKHQDGQVELYVHIADVSNYVQPDTALDIEAKRRSNSTYFPGKCIPMIPPQLADNLCSLKPNVLRLTLSVCMRFCPEGELLDYKIVKGVIKSKKRYTYEQVQEVLDGKSRDVHEKTLKQMAVFSQKLRSKRIQQGAVEISTKESVIHVDEKGVPTGTVIIDHDISHQLVEEFMVLTNKVVATHLDGKKIPAMYRIHEPPSDDNMKDFLKVVKLMGFPVSKRIDGHFLNKLFKETKDDPIGPFIVVSYIRSMRLAVYDITSKGHYGLNIDHYTHFTSPIRRYPDLVVHRALFDDVLEEGALQEIAKSSSDNERLSAKAEGSVLQLKKLRLLASYFQENPERSYQAVVTKVLPFGVVVNIEDLLLEGMVHVVDFYDDYYTFDDVRLMLIGRHGKKHIRIGTEVKVILKDIDLITNEAKWVMHSTVKKSHSKHTNKSKHPGKRTEEKEKIAGKKNSSFARKRRRK